MPNRRSTPAPVGIEKELFDAIDRLVAGTPTHPELQRKVVSGKLRVNPTTVALESGRARTLCAFEGCAYPRVYDEIKFNRPTRPKPATTFEELNKNLSRENSELRESIQLAMSRVAAMILRLEEHEKDTKRRVDTADRTIRQHEKVSSLEEVAGRVTNEQTSTVVPIKRGLRRRPKHQP